MGGWEGSGRGECEGGQWGLHHCGLGRMQEPVAKANEQYPVLGKVAMLRAKREMRGAGNRRRCFQGVGGVLWPMTSPSGNDSGKLSLLAPATCPGGLVNGANPH